MSLFERVREMLGRQNPLAKDAKGDPADLEIMAAAAVLLLEAAYGDAEYVWKEERVLVRGLERAFGIGRKETHELLGRAEEIRPPVVKLADVTEVGGFEVVNASGFSARADALNAFRFDGGPVRRYVGESKRHEVRGWNVIPGGRSGDPADASFAVQLGDWLTGEVHGVDLRTSLPPGEVQERTRLVPAQASLSTPRAPGGTDPPGR